MSIFQRRTVKPIQDPPRLLTVGITVRDARSGAGLASASAVLSPGTRVAAQGVNDGGRIAFSTFGRGQTNVELSAPGFVTRVVDVTIAQELGDYALQPAIVLPALGPLSARGKLFYMNGLPHRRKLMSAFMVPKIFRDGGANALRPLLDFTRETKIGGWRVFLQWYGNTVAPYGPQDIPPSLIAELCSYAEEEAVELKLCVLADCGAFGMSHVDNCNRVSSVLSIAAGRAGQSVQFGNEDFKNQFDAYRIATDLGLWKKENRPIPIDTGSYVITAAGGGPGNPNFRYLDEVGDHGGRGGEWVLDAGKSGHFMYDGWSPDQQNQGNVGFRGHDVTCTQDEPIGCDEVAERNKTSNDPNEWADAGAGWAIGMSGATIHLRPCMIGQVPGPIATDCARRFSEAMDFFPPEAFGGDYKHQDNEGHPLETSNECTECVSYGDGNRKYAVAAQPTPNYSPVPIDGWRITKQGGWRGNYLCLER